MKLAWSSNCALRPYQQQGKDDIYAAWKQGHRSVLFQMPTGTGKTVLFSDIVKQGYDKQRRVLVVVHRKELIEQISRKFAEKGIDAGIILAGHPSDYDKIVQVASIQTLTRREHPEANLVIIDECHHAKAKTYQRLWKLYKESKFLGVTATPIRLNGEGFDDLFDVLIPSMPVKEFIHQGYLAPVKHFVGAMPNLKGVRKQQGDYVTSQLSRVMKDNSIMADVITSYQTHAEHKSMIVFAVNIEHSQQIVERYQESGYSAVHIDSHTPKPEREDLLTRFKAKEIQILSNVEIITEGFDFPECEVVQLARPTKSLALYLQMVGRIMRPSQGKEHGIILDNANIWREHGFVTIDRNWKLHGVVEEEHPHIVVKKKGQYQTVERDVPLETSGLELVEMTPEIQRLIEVFEPLVNKVETRKYNPLHAFLEYEKYLTRRGVPMSVEEYRYIKNRVNRLNPKVPKGKQFNTYYWKTSGKDRMYTQEGQAA